MSVLGVVNVALRQLDIDKKDKQTIKTISLSLINNEDCSISI